MAKGKSNANAWLARDTKVVGGMYVVGFDGLDRDRMGFWHSKYGKHVSSLDAQHCEACITGAPKLKPGEGPIPVRISIERAE